MKHRLTSAALLLAAAVGSVGCEMTGGYNLPPAERLLEPGPGVGGPGPGVLGTPASGVAPAAYVTEAAGEMPGCLPGGGQAYAGAEVGQNVQLLFNRPESMEVFWDVTGTGQFSQVPLITPGRATFQSGGIYRLKISNIPQREGVELYPTIEIAPPSYRTAAFLAHNAIPVQFSEEDLDQVVSGNFVTKVVYLPDPEFQELTVPGVRTLVSTRLEPGLDPIVEADRRGAILSIIRVGNKDLETPDTMFGETVVPVSHQSSSAAATEVAPASYNEAGYPMAASMPAGAEMDYGGLPVGAAGCVDGNCDPQLLAQGPGGVPAGLVSGMNVPQYGMPFTGTPIGLPGPPHIPLGTPAGLQKHVMHNWTSMHVPGPTRKVKINVKQRPGLSYPHPASRAWVVEDTIHPTVNYGYHHFGAPPVGQQQMTSGFGGGLLNRIFGHGGAH